ncbi:MAG TPA: 50S ribosomal protein L1 [Candidatus Saccharimonadales bacterium]|nr:50S ribosomal protein L1 [Candidatus Saccharimonadales bacterium]
MSERRSKKYKEAAKKIDSSKSYNLKEAVGLAKGTSTTKFDGSVELHIKLGVDPRHADQNIRATVNLPHGTGKTTRVAVFAPADQHEAAKKAGADIVGEEDFLQLLDKEQIDFDILIATPQLMARLAKYAKLLGPRGLMPNPKSGTVSAKVADAVKLAKAGRVEFRVDKQGIVHQAIGKVSFEEPQLLENAQALIKVIQDAKPASVKGVYLQTIYIASTMGPGVRIDVSSL